MPGTIDSGSEPTMNTFVHPNPCLSSSSVDAAASSTTEETRPSSGGERGAAGVAFDDDDDDLMASKTVPKNMIESSSEEIDALLANELNQLSMKEREGVFHDIHGVADIVEETPDLLEKSLTSMQQEIDKISQKKKIAYLLAKEQNPHYVSNPKFLLQFLRSESFHPQKAALRLLKFLQEKSTLFGPEKVGRDILLSDLDAKDSKSVESGFLQLLPARDRAGRAILCGIPALRKYKVIENLQRTFYYMVMAALEDENTQKAGMVIVGYNMGPKRALDRQAVWGIQKLRRVLPMRVVGMHYCYDDFKMRPMMTLAMLVMGSHGRMRFRAHYGSHSQNQYNLLTFGIQNGALPVTAEGEAKIKLHKKWIQLRREEEKGPTDIERIVLPGSVDALFGRGKPIQEHPGNLRYHYILDMYQDQYEGAKKFQKMEISETVVKLVKKYHGRFLRQDGAGWVAVDDATARDKVSHAFRTRRGTSLSTTTTSTTTSASTSTSAAAPPESRTRSLKETNTQEAAPAPVPVASTSAVIASVNITDESEPDGSEEDFSISIQDEGKRAKLWHAEFYDIADTI